MENEIEGKGPLRHFRMNRRLVLQSLATGAGAMAFASAAPAAHVHEVGAASMVAATPAKADDPRLFLDQHAFDTLSALADQIVPGSRAADVPAFLDRLLSVESLDTQKRFIQALGSFELEARSSHGGPWKSLSTHQATALLEKISSRPATEPSRRAFDDLKRAVAETYYSTETGMKELGWDGSVTFAPPSVCG